MIVDWLSLSDKHHLVGVTPRDKIVSGRTFLGNDVQGVAHDRRTGLTTVKLENGHKIICAKAAQFDVRPR